MVNSMLALETADSQSSSTSEGANEWVGGYFLTHSIGVELGKPGGSEGVLLRPYQYRAKSLPRTENRTGKGPR